MNPFLILVPLLAAAAVLLLCAKANRKHVRLWLPAYVKKDWAGAKEKATTGGGGLRHVLFCIADHFEPALGKPGLADERRRVAHWLEHYPEEAAQFRDADGCPPRHTFFYPAEDYRPEHLDRLATLVSAGWGEVEIHLHHQNDTSEGLRRTFETFKSQLQSHGLLGRCRASGDVRFAFVHGNWSLDNSLPGGVWCGVNDEITVLRQAGCFADFTLPSAPSPAQTRRINSIYYAKDDLELPKSHDDGREVTVGVPPSGDLMLIQGPLAVRWTGGKGGILPCIENANLAAGQPGTPSRISAWLKTGVIVAGRPEWVFIKLHTHGCNEQNWGVLFGERMELMREGLDRLCNDGVRTKLHYVTAREMFNIAKAAESGHAGDPNQYRDFSVLPPQAAKPWRVQIGEGP